MTSHDHMTQRSCEHDDAVAATSCSYLLSSPLLIFGVNELLYSINAKAVIITDEPSSSAYFLLGEHTQSPAVGSMCEGTDLDRIRFSDFLLEVV